MVLLLWPISSPLMWPIWFVAYMVAPLFDGAPVFLPNITLLPFHEVSPTMDDKLFSWAVFDS